MTGLPQGWKTTTLSELCERITKGSTPTTYGFSYQRTGVRFVKAESLASRRIIHDRCAFVSMGAHAEFLRSQLAEGDILVTIAGTLGRVALIAETDLPANTNQAVAICRPMDKTLSPFIARYLESEHSLAAVEEARRGVGLQNLNLQQVSAFQIGLPPLSEQRRIVRKLDTLDARSATSRKHLAALEKLIPRYKLAVLRSAFTGRLTAKFREERKLEAVATLLERTPPPQQGRGGRQPTTEVTAGRGGISVNVPDIDLPEGWDWVPLLRVARQETGHTPSRSRPDWWDGDVCWMSIPDANLHHGRVIFDTIQKTNEEGLANSSARLLPAGTVVLSRTASVGYICILGKDMATSQDFATWTCTDALLPEYLMYALLSEGEDIKKFGEGSTHTTIYFPEMSYARKLVTA